MDVEVDGDEIVIRWKNKETTGPAIRLKNVGTAQVPLLRLESDPGEVQFEIAAAGDAWQFQVSGGNLEIVGEDGSQTVLRLGQTRPVIAGLPAVPGSAVEGIINTLVALRLADDGTA
jgi:hypothetical protein